MANGYVAKLKLSNYINSRVVDLENDDGEIEKGIFIPIEINGLFLSPRNQVISWLFLNEKLHDTGDGYSHYLRMKSDKKHVEYINSLGYNVPYLGLMRRNIFQTKYFEKYSKLGDGRVKNLE